MKILVINGEATNESEQKITEILEKSKEKEYTFHDFRGEKDKNYIKNFFRGTDLFDTKRLIVIDNGLFSEFSKYLNTKDDKNNDFVIIYSNKELAKGVINKIPNVDKIFTFTYPKLIWSYLESIYPGNAKNIINLLSKIEDHEPLELVFYLTFKQLRDLYLIKEKSLPGTVAPWRLQKLERQASKFKKDGLVEFINKLSNLDFQVKTGKIEIKTALYDFFAINL